MTARASCCATRRAAARISSTELHSTSGNCAVATRFGISTEIARGDVDLALSVEDVIADVQRRRAFEQLGLLADVEAGR
jgi:hypothetical protein